MDRDAFTSPQLTIVIVTWNSAKDIGACLNALERVSCGEPYDVIIVDNASRDGTCALLAKRGFVPPGDEGVKGERRWIICNGENRGFAAANNQGLSRARTPFTLFLNPDTEARPNSIRTLLTYLRQHPDVVAVGPRLTDAAGVVQGGAAGHEPTLRTVFNFSFGLYLLSPTRFPALWLARRQYEPQRPIPVDWVSGAALLVRTDVARGVGGWPEDYFLYIEDIAFCRRLRRRGRIVCLPEAHVLHHIGGSVRQAGRRGLAQNILALDRDYRSRYSLPAVFLLHGMGALGFGMRWLITLLLRRRRVAGHSVGAQELWRTCTLTSLHCLFRAYPIRLKASHSP